MFRSNLTRNGKFQKNRKKLKKIRKIPLWLHFKPKYVEKGREIRKKKLSFRFVPTRCVIENSKKIEKNSENIKIPLWLHFKP